MKKKTMKKTLQRQMTRREFVGSTLAAAGMVPGAPAFLRGQNLNNKLNIAMIACGGRGAATAGSREAALRCAGVPGGGRREAAGHEGDGIALAPITGFLIAELITTGKMS